MKTLVIFDSVFGNTKLIADSIAQEFGEGARAISVDNVTKNDLAGIELLVVGSPIIAWRPTEKMGTFLASLSTNQLQGIRAAAFDTRVKIFISGNAAKKIFQTLQNFGATMITEPQAFFVRGKEGPLLEGEVEKARAWAKSIKSTFM